MINLINRLVGNIIRILFMCLCEGKFLANLEILGIIGIKNSIGFKCDKILWKHLF